MIRRRELIAGLGAAAAWPLVARAQQSAVPVIGVLRAQAADDDYKNITDPFLQGLKETGYVERRRGHRVTDWDMSVHRTARFQRLCPWELHVRS
jgi:hypothetical protein